nr:MAG TPA: hypothetical protein [Caudoviricetes sp.]
MEYYGKKLCISVHELVDGGIISQPNYKQLSARGRINVMRRGGGVNQYALIAVESLPTKYKEAVEEKYGNGDEVILTGWIMSNYELDEEAVKFYNDHSKTGLNLNKYPEKIREYIINASVLNTCIRLYENSKAVKRTMGERYDWDRMATAIKILREQLGHTLPESTLRFRKKVNLYRSDGYSSLISGKFGNQHRRKVDYKTEQLVLSIRVLPNQPYGSDVHKMYIEFLCGELDVWDLDTGELFNPDDFTDKNGEPKELSESTIRNILNKPSNKFRIAKALKSWDAFYHEDMPYMHRHGGDFSLSQITMDDVDLPRRMKGNEYVHAYYAYDVVSQCRVGLAYGRKKDDALVVDCFRDMFRLIERKGWGMPAGIEVEQHLMSKYKEGFLKAGEVFKNVMFCAPQNSQAKYAESLNGAFKTTVAHKNHEGIGRWYNKGARRIFQKKVSDSDNHTWEDKKYYTFEELVADDRRDCNEWNNMPHPNQKKYPGMSRWDVLVARLNPTLRPLDKLTLSRYIGERVETSIRRNSTVKVAYEEWWISGPEVLERLAPNNYKVTACYLPDEDGKPTDVFIYQGDKYIDKLHRITTYNRVMAEQTDADKEAFIEQRKYVVHFDKYLRDNAIAKVGKMAIQKAAPMEEEALELPQVEMPKEDFEYMSSFDYGKMALGDY